MSTTYAPPETVTVRAEALFETLALLDACAIVIGDLHDEPGLEWIFEISDKLYDRTASTLIESLEDDDDADTDLVLYQAMVARSEELAAVIRSGLPSTATTNIAAHRELATLKDQVRQLGENVIGVHWNGDFWASESGDE